MTKEAATVAAAKPMKCACGRPAVVTLEDEYGAFGACARCKAESDQLEAAEHGASRGAA